MVRPRFFVSSVIRDFAPFREVARKAVERAGGEPVLVNEDLPADDNSSRNACLDAVESCDYLLLILGERGGWTAPSGKLVVEEEYEHARARQLTVLAFIQNGPHDETAARLVAKVSDYVTGRFRVAFENAADLGKKVEQALLPLLKGGIEMNTANHDIWSRLNVPLRSSTDTSLRLVMLPERKAEMVDPLRFGDDIFVRRLCRLAFDDDVRLFTYAAATTTKVGPDDLTIAQGVDGQHGLKDRRVAVNLCSDGGLVVEAAIAPAEPARGNFDLSSWTITHAQLRATLQPMFGFARALLAELDPHRRFDRLLYNVALLNLSYRNIAKDRPSPSQSQTLNSQRGEGPIIAMAEPRLVNHAGLGPAQVETEISRLIELLVRRAA